MSRMTNKTLMMILPLAAWLGAAGCGDLADVNPALAVRYAPDGTLVVFTGVSIDLYDTQLAMKQDSIPAPQTGGGYGICFSLSDDGTVASVSDINPTTSRTKIDMFSIPDRGKLPAVDLGPPPKARLGYAVEDLALSPHGDLVYVMGGVADDYRKVAMFDTATGAMLWSGDWAIAPAFSSDGSQIYVSGNHGLDVQRFDARSGVSVLDAPV